MAGRGELAKTAAPVRTASRGQQRLHDAAVVGAGRGDGSLAGGGSAAAVPQPAPAPLALSRTRTDISRLKGAGGRRSPDRHCHSPRGLPGRRTAVPQEGPEYSSLTLGTGRTPVRCLCVIQPRPRLHGRRSGGRGRALFEPLFRVGARTSFVSIQGLFPFGQRLP